MKRKYVSEFGLNMRAAYRVLLQQDTLEKLEEIPFNPHIYMVLQRPKITIDPYSTKYNDRNISVVFEIHSSEKKYKVPATLITDTKKGNLELVSKYPYADFYIYNNGNEISHSKCAPLFDSLCFLNGKLDYSNLEVLYVGQSYGNNGSRTANDRLINHSTLQKIYHDTMIRSPDKEIWLLLCSFTEVILASFDGRSKSIINSRKEDDDHIENIVNMEMTEKHKINFTEAALIKYFKPKYNTKFKESFPKPNHSSYSQCYDIDLNMISVEIDTEDLNCKLCSKDASPQLYHICNFPLHSREERKYMFDF